MKKNEFKEWRGSVRSDVKKALAVREEIMMQWSPEPDRSGELDRVDRMLSEWMTELYGEPLEWAGRGADFNKMKVFAGIFH